MTNEEERKPVHLGVKARDTVTGFVGTVTGYYCYTTGGDRCGVEAMVGGKVEHNVFDADRLELVEESPEPADEPTA